jgi:hypothetical protein
MFVRLHTATQLLSFAKAFPSISLPGVQIPDRMKVRDTYVQQQHE